MTYSINGITLSVITDEKNIKDAQLFTQPMPGADSDEAIVLDIFGCQRTITISGENVGTPTDVKNFVLSLDNLAKGNQSSVVYVSDILGSINVLINRVTWEVKGGEPTTASWELELIQGKI